MLVVWANAAWHKSQIVRTWTRTQNRQVKAGGAGVHIVPCRLPSKRPWLNLIEPKWGHGKRAVLEPARSARAPELAARVCA